MLEKWKFRKMSDKNVKSDKKKYIRNESQLMVGGVVEKVSPGVPDK